MIVNGEDRDVWKTPVGDSTKNSKKGRLALVNDYDEGWMTVPEGRTLEAALHENLLQMVYENGEIVKRYTLDEVRQNTGMLNPIPAEEIAV